MSERRSVTPHSRNRLPSIRQPTRGAAKAKVEAVFDVSENDAVFPILKELGVDVQDGELMLSRELTLAGRNVCRVNGVLVPVASLKSVSDALIDIHGQHEHQSLLDPENHIGYLDAYCHEILLFS